MFKKISEAYAVLSNPDRRTKYDKWGQTGKDDDFGFGDDGDFEAFMNMFGGGGGFADDLEDFIDFLEKDEQQFKNLFRGLGRNYRGGLGGKRGNLRSKAKNKHGGGGAGMRGGRKDEEAMMEEMMAAMMMGDLMSMGLDDDDLEDGFGFGMNFGKKGKARGKAAGKKAKAATKKKKEEDDDDGWQTDSEEEVVEAAKGKNTDNSK